VGEEVGVEAGADGLVEVEGQDGLARAMVAQVPDHVFPEIAFA
jgi:hypothetical protein